MAVMQSKVPAAIATGIICLLVGGGLGAAIMSYAQGDAKPAAAGGGGEEGKGDLKAGGEGKGGKGGFGGKGGGKGGGAGGFGGRGPASKAQLAQLVTKLDTLTAQSLHIDLTPEQKKQAKDLLAGLAEKDAVTDEEAKEKLEALLKVLEANRKTLEDAGYRWPGAGGGMGGGGMPPAPPPNPFKEGDGANHLKSLQATLAK